VTPPAGGVTLHEYAVGKYGDTFNDNTGRLLKAGTKIRFDMHYFAVGEAMTDQTELGIIFYPKGYTPKYNVQSVSFRNLPNDELEVPPNSIARHDGYFRLTRPVRIDAFQPHMHMRGKAMTLEAINLDNTVTVLSSVDHFDFGWHVAYLYADDEAPLLPAGTILHMTGVHDNTAANKKNPDPAELVRGRAARVIGELTGALTLVKGLPLAYQRDLQDGVAPLLDAVTVYESSLEVMTGLIATLTVDAARMAEAAREGYTTATAVADTLVRRADAMHLEPFTDDLADRHAWAERAERVLEDDLHLLAQRPDIALAECLQVLTVEADAAGAALEPQQGEAERGLARA